VAAAPGGPGHRRGRRAAVGWVAGGAAVALAIGSVAVAVDRSHSNSSQQASSTPPSSRSDPFTPNGQYGVGSPNGSTGGTGTATAAQQVGVVDVNTVLDFGTAKAAGTGIVLTSAGEVLTNNHVIDGSTSISVTVVSTGNSYTARVVGTDPTDDIAVLQLENASGLATAKIGDSSAVGVGDTVTAVGNAGGTGGVPSSATGTVTALNQKITASDQGGSNPETLTGMIELNADIQAGDSGGPLYASDGTIVGIDTAGSSSPASASPVSATTTGFAIPIAKATSIAGEIESGAASSRIHLGYPAFLGVQLDPASPYTSTGGAAIAGVVTGSAAARAGLQAGDTITALNGTTIAGSSGLSSALAGLEPGQQVRVGWVDSSGRSHTATVTLTAGPAD
jgi:S1-C subfamily serine protease